MGRFSLFFFLFALPLIARSEQQNVRVSILSLLQPNQIKLTMLSPAAGMLRNSEGEMPIVAGKTFQVQSLNGGLYSSGLSEQHLSLNCPDACRVQIQIDSKMRRVYTGQFDFYYNNSTIQIVLTIPYEKLIASVASSEMREARQMEAIKAFAVVSRSFLTQGRRHPEKRADFCDTTHCQVFQNLEASAEIRDAVQKSEALVLTYRNQSFQPFYSRSCGGYTATFQDAWGERSPTYEFPSVQCPCSDRTTSWQAFLSFAELTGISGLAHAKMARNGGRIVISSNDTEKQFPLEVFRSKLGRAYGWKRLPGNRYELAQTAEGYVFHGNGQGHGVGFCQTGAALLAAKGLSFSEILSHYFPSTELKNISDFRFQIEIE